MNIDSIETGIVLDHVQAKKGMEIYKHLHLDELDCTVAIMRNVRSGKMGHKDIIKIGAAIDLDFDVLGYIDPGVTVNIIRDGKLVDKKRIELPQRVVNVISCTNPRCITSTEQELDQVFDLTDKQRRIYSCHYCEEAKKSS